MEGKQREVTSEPRHGTRRHFLKQASLGTAAAVAAGHTLAATTEAEAPSVTAKTQLPTVSLGDHAITRLVAGYNPIGGHSHLTTTMSRMMSDYFTVDQTVAFLKHCEELGINAFQFDLTEKTEQVLEKLWSDGSKLNFICLHAERGHDASLDHLMKFKPIAIAHHGGVTDHKFSRGEAEHVHDFVKKVHDAGALAGVSAHDPRNITRIYEEGWENDFFMTCFQFVTRPRKAMEEQWGFATVGEPYIDSDRDEMTKTMRGIDKPCLGFKILAAGRRCNNGASVETAFRYAYEHIKPADAVIVGMFPYFQDEVKENVGYALKYA